MKLVIAIVHDDDSNNLIEELNKSGFSVTKLATTGGFLKSGNTTLLTGVNKEKVDEAIEIIKNICKEREEFIPTSVPITESSGMYMQYPVEVRVGGATIFVVDVDKFIKV